MYKLLYCWNKSRMLAGYTQYQPWGTLQQSRSLLYTHTICIHVHGTPPFHHSHSTPHLVLVSWSGLVEKVHTYSMNIHGISLVNKKNHAYTLTSGTQWQNKAWKIISCQQHLVQHPLLDVLRNALFTAEPVCVTTLGEHNLDVGITRRMMPTPVVVLKPIWNQPQNVIRA